MHNSRAGGTEFNLEDKLQYLPPSFTTKLEKLRVKHPEGVEWAYQLFHSWQDKSQEWTADVITSFSVIIQAVQAPAPVRDDLVEINQIMLECPYMVRYEQFRNITEEVIDFYEQCTAKNNDYLYELGIQFRKKAFLGSFPDVLRGLRSLPADTPEVLIGLLGQAVQYIDVAGREVIHDNFTQHLNNLMRTLRRAVEADLGLEDLLGSLEIKQQKLRDYVINLNGQVSIALKEAVTFDYQEPTPLDNYYEEILIIRGKDAADRLRDNCSLDELNQPEFLAAYVNVLLGNSNEEEEGLVGLMFCRLAEYNEQTTNLQEIIQRGKVELKPAVAEGLTQEAHKMGREIEIKSSYDLRPEQANLYASYQAMRHYQRLVDGRFSPENYQRLMQKLHEEKSLERDIIIIGGGCGPAKKEIVCYKELLKLSYHPKMLLTDINLEAIRVALVNCIKADMSRPEFRFWDLLNLNYSHFEEVQEIVGERQIIFPLFGGTSGNISNLDNPANDAAIIYSNLRDILVKRAGTKEGVKPDLVLTEGDSKKDIKYYRQPNSRAFLNYGLMEGHQISAEHLLYPEPIYILDEEENKICAFYLTKEESPLSPAVWVIDSKALVEEEFNQTNNVIGFTNQFFYQPDGSVLAVSKIH